MPAPSSALLARLQCGHEDVETTATLARSPASSFALDDAETSSDDDDADAVTFARPRAVTLARPRARAVEDDDDVEDIITDVAFLAHARMVARRVGE